MTHKLGSCFKTHGKAIASGHLGGLLCHGVVWHKKLGWHAHAWIEQEEEEGIFVRDFADGHDTTMERCVYYIFRQVTNVKRYTVGEARAKIRETGSHGPWHDMKELVPSSC